MIYLIGGAPRCGKTTLAQAVARTRGCSWIPTDYLMSAFNRYATEPVTQLAPGESNDVRYTQHSIDEIVQSYHRRADAAAAGISSIVEYAHSEGRDLVLEGFHLEPMLIRHLRDAFTGLRATVLVCLDRPRLIQRLRQRGDPTDWVTRRTNDAATIPKIADMVALYSEQLLEEATAVGIPVVSGDESLDSAVRTGLEQLIDPPPESSGVVTPTPYA